MDTRNKIGIIYQKSDTWIGGVYYIQNLISALNLLESKKQPIIEVFCNNKADFEELAYITSYTNLIYHHYESRPRNIFSVFLSKISLVLRPKKYLQPNAIDLTGCDLCMIYPVGDRSQVTTNDRTLAWIPDFQERYYPQNFSKRAILSRKRTQRGLVNNQIPIVFSSSDSLEDFNRYYPNNSCNKYVLRFAVTHPDFSNENIKALKLKYGIYDDYFICANQFWTHKNHKVLFEAFAKYRARGGRRILVCSGKMQDYRNPKYIDELKAIISNNKLDNYIVLTGFIDRKEQLCLLSNSEAIIQPSLFEGWSTIVEDAKSLNKFIFVSDLRVHKEQQPLNSAFFDPNDSDALATLMLNTAISTHPYDYDKDRVAFASAFAQIVEDFAARVKDKDRKR